MSLIAELKRRNVFRVGVAYGVVAWLLIQVADIVLPTFEAPEWVMQVFTFLLILGFPLVLIFAWAFELTPEGIKRESEVNRSRSITHQTAKRLDLLTIGLVVIAIGLFVVDRSMPDLFDHTTVSSAGATDTEGDVAWVTQQLLEIDRLRDLGENRAAFILAIEVEPLLKDDAAATKLWEGFSWASDVNSNPAGARVYRQPIDAAEDEWEDLGTTPLKAVRFADGEGYRLRFELVGHRPVELLQNAVRQFEWRFVETMKPVRMDPVDVLPEGMVRIPGFTNDLVEYADFFMDRYEVTNREFEQFVAAGGYETPEYWLQPFVRDGAEISWNEAMSQFVDRTGRPGPSTWIGGAYPDGQGGYPVNGVSWFEAAAYAEFTGKELPTPAHMERARAYYFFDGGLVASRSNLGGNAPRPVGHNRAMTTLGVYDLVGNVREWCWNEAGQGTRGTTGAAWTDAPFHVSWIIPKSPWDRHETHGFRTIRTFDSHEKLARLRQPETPHPRRDLMNEKRVSDEEFKIYRRMYAYDSLPLNATVVAVDEFEHWTRERIDFDLPYGERGGAYLYIPNRSEAPFDAVIYWGGSSLLEFQSVDEEYLEAFNFIIRSGRVVAAPIFKGTFDRDDSAFSLTSDSIWGDSEFSAGTNWRDFQIKWVQDLSRTIDYLETREDINSDRLGFYGLSWGGGVAPIVLAVEDRIDAAVLNVGGLDDIYQYLPEADPFTFVTHVHDPVLMLNGEYDIVFPLETSQEPMFELLGTDPEHKKHYVTSAGHMVPRDALIRETLDWFDRYLGAPEN
jgi:dienelactone hydrolase